MQRAYIEITNVCNLSCSFCRKNHRDPRFMSADDFERALGEILPYTNYIYLHVQGEPLLHPDFRRIMEICCEQQARIALVTNGSLLKNYPDLLSFPALHRLSVSLQSAAFHETGSARELMKTIQSLMHEASKNSRPYLELRFWRKDLLTAPAVAECHAFLKENYAFRETGTANSFRLLPYVFVNYDRAFEWPVVPAQSSVTSGTCLGARRQIAVLSNGDVVPCCLDAEGAVVFGNLFERDLKDILAAERYKKMTEGFEQYKVVEPLCQSCTFRYRFSKPEAASRP